MKKSCDFKLKKTCHVDILLLMEHAESTDLKRRKLYYGELYN